MKNPKGITQIDKETSSQELLNFRSIYDTKYITAVYYIAKSGVVSNEYPIEIDFEDNIIGGRVNVYWDKFIRDYKELGLFGYYDAYYCRMKVIDTSLEIIQTNGIIVKISFTK